MQWLPPGAAEEDGSPSPALTPSKAATGQGHSPKAGQQGAGLHTDIWELVSGEWKVTYQFDAGLEYDSFRLDSPLCRRQSHVHLPSTSLRSLQRLRGLFARSDSIAWDAEPPVEHCHAIFSTLMEHLSSAVTSENKIEALSTLRTRDGMVRQASVSDDGIERTFSEDIMRPGKGKEGVDISICPLNSFGTLAPEVALAKLTEAANFGSHSSAPVRYVMLVLCGNAQASVQQAQEVARAFAGAVMDEDFATALVRSSRDKAGGLLSAIDTYLSNVTIVPTVYVKPGQVGSASSSPSHKGKGLKPPDMGEEQLLADSLVDNIEKLICESRDMPQSELAEHKGRRQATGHMRRLNSLDSTTRLHRQRFFVDVSTVKPGVEWRTTHRLSQGLELNAVAQSAKPHLPHVSVPALMRARQLLTPECIGLSVSAHDPQALIDALVQQLNLAGLPMLATSELSEALERHIAPGDDTIAWGCAKPTGFENFKVLEPTGSEEACHVLSIACKQFPISHAPVAAFVRIKLPLSVKMPLLKIPARFFFVVVGSEASELDLVSLGDSVAALATDEDLMGELDSAAMAQEFLDAFDNRLDHVTIVPHTRVSGKLTASASSVSALTNGDKGSMSSRKVVIDIPEELESHASASGRTCMRKALHVMQKYSLPLVSGVVIAMIWGNVDINSFNHFTSDAVVEGWHVLGHPLSLKFLVNDIFMCFFFGLAVKEVTEAVLPGGSLSPLKRAVNPLMATLGGIVGPAVAYIVFVLVLWSAGTFEGTMCSTTADSTGHRRLGVAAVSAAGTEPCTLSTLINGWGVPTATDISLAWMFALLIFGSGHPSINFLLLLAIVDDAIGMGIIAIQYSDPDHPVEPVWLLLNLAAVVVSIILRKLRVPYWQAYIICGAPFAWFGLLKAHVHPALALCCVVPLMPASGAIRAQEHVRDLGACDLGPQSPIAMAEEAVEHMDLDMPEDTLTSKMAQAAELLERFHSEEAPLHVFEHTMKLPVDLGMFFFGLCNAGVKLDAVGGVTGSVVFALIVGKTLGIAFFSLFAACIGFGLPAGVSVIDLFAMSAVGGVGLTVALFVANEAFVDSDLQGQAKFGAVLSVLAAVVAWLIKAVPAKLCPGSEVDDEDIDIVVEAMDIVPTGDGRSPVAAAGFMEDCLVDDILHVLYWQRRYAIRGEQWAARTVTKTHSVGVGKSPSVAMGMTRTSSGENGAVIRVPSKQGVAPLTPTWGPAALRVRTPAGTAVAEPRSLA